MDGYMRVLMVIIPLFMALSGYMMLVTVRRRRRFILKIFGVPPMLIVLLIWEGILIWVMHGLIMNISVGDVIVPVGNAFRNFSISDAIDRISGFIVLGLAIIAITTWISSRREVKK